MTRLGAAFWIGLVLASGFTTFKVKYAVQEIDDELARVRKQAIAEQQEIRVLAAEWTYLNQPDRLAEFNRIYLQLAPLTAKQLQQRIDEIPWRAPPAAAEVMVAANSAPSRAAAPTPTVEAPPPPSPAASRAAALAVLTPAAGGQAPRLRLARATPGSLDALIARIADPR
jgi:hypothetical protein